jgi:hypothetical protein
LQKGFQRWLQIRLFYPEKESFNCATLIGDSLIRLLAELKHNCPVHRDFGYFLVTAGQLRKINKPGC